MKILSLILMGVIPMMECIIKIEIQRPMEEQRPRRHLRVHHQVLIKDVTEKGERNVKQMRKQKSEKGLLNKHNSTNLIFHLLHLLTVEVLLLLLSQAEEAMVDHIMDLIMVNLYNITTIINSNCCISSNNNNIIISIIINHHLIIHHFMMNTIIIEENMIAVVLGAYLGQEVVIMSEEVAVAEDEVAGEEEEVDLEVGVEVGVLIVVVVIIAVVMITIENEVAGSDQGPYQDLDLGQDLTVKDEEDEEVKHGICGICPGIEMEEV